MTGRLKWTIVMVFLFSGINMSFVSAQVEDNWMDRCQQENEKICSQMVDVDNFQKQMNCAMENKSQFSLECQRLLEKSIEQYNAFKEGCEKELKEYCGARLSDLVAEGSGQNMQCLLEHWGWFLQICQRIFVEQLPYVESLRDEGDLERYTSFRYEYSKKVLPGNGKMVKVVREKDGVTWYLADLIKKDITEEFEFCPEVADKGLERGINAYYLSCSYEVIAEWKNELIERLVSTDLAERITYIGLRNPGNEITDPEVLEIVNSYEKNCPAGFEVDFINSVNRNEKRVYCKRKKWFDCPAGWYKTKPKDGKFFGCRRYASCEEVNPDSFEIGNPKYCAVCQAGGCINTSKIRTGDNEFQIGYCQVNAENPVQMPKCE